MSPPPYCQVYGARTLYMMRIKQHGIAGGPLLQEEPRILGADEPQPTKGLARTEPMRRLFPWGPYQAPRGGAVSLDHSGGNGRGGRNGQGGAPSGGAAGPNCLTRLTRALAIT